jgi:hypothetical protein
MDVTSQINRTHQPSRPAEALRWIGAMVVGEVIGLGAAASLAVGVDPVTPGSGDAQTSVVIAAAAGAMAGTCIGAGQWPVLRRIVGELDLSAWILASALGGALAWMLGTAGAASGPYDVSSLWAVAIAVALAGFVLGASFGLLQASALSHRPNLAKRWPLANGLGWSFGLLLAYVGVLGTVFGSWPDSPIWTAMVSLIWAAMMLVAPAVATSFVLRARPR